MRSPREYTVGGAFRGLGAGAKDHRLHLRLGKSRSAIGRLFPSEGHAHSSLKNTKMLDQGGQLKGNDGCEAKVKEEPKWTGVDFS